MFKSLTAFLTKVASRLGGIAWATKSGLKGKDLHGDVWLAASDIEEKRGHPVDFEDAVDQEMVISRVYWKLKGERDWQLDGAVRLDAEVEDNSSWADRIAEVVSMDPVAVSARRESATREEILLDMSFSQAAAYVAVLTYFKSDRKRICAHMAIGKTTLSDRLIRAGMVVRRQPSLFDGIHSFEGEFMPALGRGRRPVVPELTEMDQAALELEPEMMAA